MQVVSKPMFEPKEFRRLEDRRLFLRYQRYGDAAARERLVERFMPLARQVARRYQRPDQPLDDLIQVASLGLLKAIDRFDTDRGTAFTSYAVPTMAGEIRRHLRDSGWALHVPRGMQDLALKVHTVTIRLGRTLGRAPTAAEVAADLGVTAEDVLEAMEAAAAHDTMSLDMPRTQGDGEAATYADTVGAPDSHYELLEYRSAIAGTFRALPHRDRLMLRLRFEEDLTQLEIAERVGVSQMHVSRIIRRALDRLRVAANAA